MYSNIFSAQSIQDLMSVLPSLPVAIWETFYVTVVSTALSLVLGLPLGVLLVAGERNGVLPLPRWLMQVLNVIINLLRSIPFLILMIMVFPLSRLLIGTAVGTTATIVPLVAAAFPFVARLVESSLREVDGNIIEAAQSMGATPMQIICKVMIPESVPSLIQNVTIALTTILGYSAMSGIIGGGGLGQIAINYGYYRYKYLTMLVAVILLIVIVQIFQTVGTKLTIKSEKRLRRMVYCPLSRQAKPDASSPKGGAKECAASPHISSLPLWGRCRAQRVGEGQRFRSSHTGGFGTRPYDVEIGAEVNPQAGRGTRPLRRGRTWCHSSHRTSSPTVGEGSKPARCP